MAGIKGITTTPSTTTNVGTSTKPTSPAEASTTLGAIGAASADASAPAPRITTAEVPETMAAEPVADDMSD